MTTSKSWLLSVGNKNSFFHHLIGWIMKESFKAMLWPFQHTNQIMIKGVGFKQQILDRPDPKGVF